MKILFVCSGNTCRSPMAELISRELIKYKGLDKIIKVESLGFYGPAGEMITSGAKHALKKLGIRAGNKKSKLFDKNKAKNYKLIIAMTNGLKAQINLPNCFSMADFTGQEILDPYGQNDEVYLACAKQIKASVETIFKRILED